MRNHSDPARDPDDHPGVRVVTHPRRLHTPRSSSSSAEMLEFRTYAFRSDPTSGDEVLEDPITLQLFGGDFRSSLVVECQSGGIDPNCGTSTTGTTLEREYSVGPAQESSDSALLPYEMNYEVGYASSPQPHTWIRFYNTPLTCRPVSSIGTSGLHSDAWLHGLEYIPSPVWNDPGGFYALTNKTGPGMPKNTVRWKVRLPQSAVASTLDANDGC